MGGLVKNIFGGGKTKVSETPISVPIKYSDPRDFVARAGGNTLSVRGGSNVNLTGGRVNKIARSALTDIKNQKGRVGQLARGLRGNNNAFIQARVRPMESALSEQLATQSRDFAQRGVFGSLSANEQTKARFLGEQAIADERAKATDESLSKLFDAETLSRGLTQDQAGVAETLMKDELSRLGLSLEALQLSLGDQRRLTEVGGSNTTTKAPTDILGGIGKIIGIVQGGQSLSDRRAKTNINKLPFEVCGLPFYTFTYLWGESSAGFMADEVKEKYPHAVEEINGVMFVNYSEVLNAG